MQQSAPTPVAQAMLAALRARHTLGTRPIVPLRHPGTGNTVYFIGKDLVLRVPRALPSCIAGAHVEALVVPLARQAGVRAPRLVAFDAACDILPVPYTLYERIPGLPLLQQGCDGGAPAVWHALGADLARLHAGVVIEGPAATLWPLAPPDEPDARPWLLQLAREGTFSPGEADWLEGLLDRRLAPGGSPARWRFCHGDVHTGNVMVDSGATEYRALLDWSSAGWGDAAWDFAAVPFGALPPLRAGYGTVAPRGAEPSGELIALRHLQLSLFGLHRGRDGSRAQAITTAARLLAGLRTFLG